MAPGEGTRPTANAPGRGTRPTVAYRLSNTSQGIDELMRVEQGILLRNALVDSRLPMNLGIPAHLRAKGDPGAYVVQARGALDEAFRGELKKAGATIVSYIPNNAYLVRVSEAGARWLSGRPNTQSVLAWEPYFKLSPKLLAAAVEQKPTPSMRLNLLAYPGEEEALRQALAGMRVQVFAQDRSPFGTQLMVRMKEDALLALAQLSAVQLIEPYAERKPANDLSRVRVGASGTTESSGNSLGLTGAGVTVNVNDTGIWQGHPDLAGRVGADSNYPSLLIDPNGHGTHVAGTVGGNGAMSSTVVNASGSTNTASFAGIAPGVTLFAQGIDLITGPLVSDAYLQETASRSNIFISNNSWFYPGASDYTLAAANWDMAVRDAIPNRTNSQPLLVVFAAGNEGGGNSDGQGGGSGSITSPGTAKNVITVGAIENYRHITNQATVSGQRVTPFYGSSDSSNQVAHFSSRGNVGIGVEGSGGRFKPDVVAPGTWLVSCRSSSWTNPMGTGSTIHTYIRDQVVEAGQTNLDIFSTPNNAVAFQITILTNAQSPVPMPGLDIRVSDTGIPTSADPGGVGTYGGTATGYGNWYYNVGNSSQQTVNYDVHIAITVTNNTGDIYTVLQGLNDQLGQYYRYESGSSMAAPVVSGLLALMQEFFQGRGETNSPALMKALLINGSRSVNDTYSFEAQPLVNYQGWGLPNLTNILRSASAGTNGGGGSLFYFDQDPTGNVLVTGQSHTRTFGVSPTARNYPLRITLTWTDPPGNPAASIKLVNDLDLIVTNLDSGTVYVGNSFGSDSTFNDPTVLNYTNISGTNSIVVSNSFATDLVNNVENVYVNLGLAPGARFSVTVRAHRVNVNAVTAHTNGIAQDYALVISSDEGAAGSLTHSPAGNTPGTDVTPNVTSMITNGIPLLHQRVGANSPLLTDSNAITNGMTNQWHFYVFNNTNSVTFTNSAQTVNPTGGQYVAFVTFFPPNLSRTRHAEADIDMYVSLNPALTNLDENVFRDALTRKSLSRRGTESVILTNAAHGDIYYIGIKSEDQQSAEYGFYAVSSSTPFDQTDTNGNVTIFGFPAEIPDGSPEEPDAGLVFAFCTQEITMRNVIVTNTLTHEMGGDLIGTLSHGTNFAVLNNHRIFQETESWIYDDSDSGEIEESQPTDGPSSLRNFTGEDGMGVWQLTEVDSAQFHTGRVDQLIIHIERLDETNLLGDGIWATIQPNHWYYTAVDVPADATNLVVCVSDMTNGPVEVYLRRGAYPTRTDYDAFATYMPPGGCLSLTPRDSPPLSMGRYYIGLFNPTAVPITVRLAGAD